MRVNATLGFGRSHVAPLISRFVREHPRVEVQLQLSINPPLLADDLFDVCARFGEPPDSRVVARRIAANRRLLCAAPAYLDKHGHPKTPRDLSLPNCIGIRQGDEAHGVWRLSSGRNHKQRTESVKVRGNLLTNDGEIAVNWALAGHGILMRAEWAIARHLRSGRLVPVLSQFTTPTPTSLRSIHSNSNIRLVCALSWTCWLDRCNRAERLGHPAPRSHPLRNTRAGAPTCCQSRPCRSDLL